MDEKVNIGHLSEYEKMVQKNRDEKMAFLASLRMDEAREDLNQAIQSLKPKRPCIKRHGGVLASQVPARKSLRLEDVEDIDFSEKAFEARAMGVKEKKIDLADLPTKKELPPILSFKEAITRDDAYTDFACDFEDFHFKKAQPFKNYVSAFKKMKINKSKIAKVVNGRITAMAFHPRKEKKIVCAGDRLGAIGFWRVGKSKSPPYEFKPHLDGVSCLKFNSAYPNQIISSSYDGTMRCGDMEKKVFREVYNVSKETSCSYFDFISPTNIVVSHQNGIVSILDLRSDSKSAEKSHKGNGYSIRTVSVHPVKKNYFVSADSKGLLSLFDLRNLQKTPVIEVNHHRKIIRSAFFSPVKGNSILTTSADNSLCLFNSSQLGHDLPLDTEVRHDNNYGEGLTTFKATWLPNTDDVFVIGSKAYPREIQIFNNSMNNIYNFRHDKYLASITSNNIFHPSLPVLAGGNFSGKVFVFS